jgi:meiotically up-regulated gene 157 (Mug157) protein
MFAFFDLRECAVKLPEFIRTKQHNKITHKITKKGCIIMGSTVSSEIYNDWGDFKVAISELTEYRQLHRKVFEFSERIQNEKLKSMFVRCFFNTLSTTVNFESDGSVFVITGDIDAMWLRDSTAQVMQYMEYVDDCDDVKKLIKGLLKKQYGYMCIDPYSNSFNKEANGRGHNGDLCYKSPYVWERKFELDSLCYPIWLTFKYFDKTGDASVFTDDFYNAASVALGVFEKEQNHHKNSDYYHFRPSELPEFSVPNEGKGDAVKVNGLIWSGYRPSDDPCKYGYFIPGNMFVCVILRKLAALKNPIASRAAKLEKKVHAAIESIGVYNHPEFGKIYAYETDGLGNYNLMDDANVPSLLSIPYYEYLPQSDKTYQATRMFVLSRSNPYYFSGKLLTGVGSPHTPENHVWPISLCIQGLTSDDETEINKMVDMIMASENNTGFIHEGINKDDGADYSRDWFAWANSLFAYFLIKKHNKIKYIK